MAAYYNPAAPHAEVPEVAHHNHYYIEGVPQQADAVADGADGVVIEADGIPDQLEEFFFEDNVEEANEPEGEQA